MSGEVMYLRLCDNEGMVKDKYIKTLNELRWLSNQEPYEGNPFPCTGSMHTADMLIRCDSPAHN